MQPTGWLLQLWSQCSHWRGLTGHGSARFDLCHQTVTNFHLPWSFHQLLWTSTTYENLSWTLLQISRTYCAYTELYHIDLGLFKTRLIISNWVLLIAIASKLYNNNMWLLEVSWRLYKLYILPVLYAMLSSFDIVYYTATIDQVCNYIHNHKLCRLYMHCVNRDMYIHTKKYNITEQRKQCSLYIMIYPPSYDNINLVVASNSDYMYIYIYILYSRHCYYAEHITRALFSEKV